MISPPVVDWQGWLRRWDAQQTGYLPAREERFTAMLDVLELQCRPDMVVLDLACGPGSISERVLARFPQARCIALDYDPVLLKLGQEAQGTHDGRLRWVEADLRSADWIEQLGETTVDAVLSTTALHWLSPEALVRTYRHLGDVVREGGVVLNGDNIPFVPHLPTFGRIGQAIFDRASHTAFAERGVEDWARWWEALENEPGLAELFALRRQRFPEAARREQMPNIDLHEAALRDAGFREVGIIWQHFDDRIVMAVR
jgi:SAM-dependent methyltransferase